MRTRTWLERATLIGAASCMASVAAAAQSRTSGEDWLDQCRDNNRRDNDRVVYCELRDVAMSAPSGALTVDGRQNGGISVRGEDRRDVRVEARIQVWGSSESRARDLASQIRISSEGGSVRADGPGGSDSWSVSYDIVAPRRSDLSLRAKNGGIRVSDVSGRMTLSTENGGIKLDGAGGDVRGETVNGGLDIKLAGERWQGAGLDVVTQNGGVRMSLPSSYAARLETGTVNGHVSIDFPITVQGQIGRQISSDINGGGPTVRAVTTNGGVRITRQ